MGDVDGDVEGGVIVGDIKLDPRVSEWVAIGEDVEVVEYILLACKVSDAVEDKLRYMGLC